MTDVVILGAGASVSAGVPAANRMAQEMISHFENANVVHHRSYLWAIRFAVGGLLFQKGVKNENPFNGVNVEELFNAIRLLAERGELEAAPFISAWHSIVESIDRPEPDYRSAAEDLKKAVLEIIGNAAQDIHNPSSSDEITRSIKALGESRWSSSSIDKQIFAMIKESIANLKSRTGGFAPHSAERAFKEALAKSGKSGTGAVFETTGALMIMQLSKMVWVDDVEKVKYLAPLIKLNGDERRVIVTLNYDNTVELAGSAMGLSIETGIEKWSANKQLPIGCPGLSLIKLHGSIDWEVKSIQVDGVLPSSSVEKISAQKMQSEKSRDFRPAVVFGGKNKLTVEGPFLDLLRWFESELEDALRVTVIGYSFRDEHVNAIICKWLTGNNNRGLRIINGPSYRHEPRSEFAQQLMYLAQNRKRVEVLPEYAAEGIAKCYGELSKE